MSFFIFVDYCIWWRLLSKQVSDEKVGKNAPIVLADIAPGDLVCVDWYDANIGKSRASSSVEVPVKSFGIFVMVAKAKKATILLAQNCFEYADGFFDVDYMAIPAAWSSGIQVISKQYISRRMAEGLAESFMVTKNAVKRSVEPRAFLHRQQRLYAHRGRF